MKHLKGNGRSCCWAAAFVGDPWSYEWQPWAMPIRAFLLTGIWTVRS